MTWRAPVHYARPWPQVVQYFSKAAGDALMVPLGRAAVLFHSIAPAYFAAHVGPAADGDDPAQDSDGGDRCPHCTATCCPQCTHASSTVFRYSLPTVYRNGTVSYGSSQYLSQSQYTL